MCIRDSLKGLGTGIRNLTMTYEKKKQEIEQAGTISSGFNLKAAGIVEVT